MRRPAIEAVGALWNPDTSSNGWFACPDNAAVDNQRAARISTDQGDNWPRTGRSDGLFALETKATRRGPRTLLPLPDRGRTLRPLLHP